MPAPSSPFRSLPFMGVIRVNNEAITKHGWKMGDPAWTNLGQGMPEVGDIPGAPPRFNQLTIEAHDHAYGPVEGIPELRQAVADHYNRLFRKGKKSQYTMENVAIAGGGRLALSRIGAALDKTRLGYFTPDYTAYEDLMTTFHRLDPVWIDLPAKDGFKISPAALEARVAKDNIGALLISNPCNPTGVMIQGDELAAWAAMARTRGTVLLMDEFYSHYHFSSVGTPASGPISTASHIEDVNADPVVIIDGLTKCYRYPGWRMGWVLAPKHVIHTLTAAGSFLDGGSSRPIQRAAIEVLKPARADQETDAVRKEFAIKQKITISRLQELGITFGGPFSSSPPSSSFSSSSSSTSSRGAGVPPASTPSTSPSGTFYAWGNISNLPAPINHGEGFMREAFKHQVLTVPGEFFDVNPHRSRTAKSALDGFVRFSFGPPRANLEAGLERLAVMVRGLKK